MNYRPPYTTMPTTINNTTSTKFGSPDIKINAEIPRTPIINRIQNGSIPKIHISTPKITKTINTSHKGTDSR